MAIWEVLILSTKLTVYLGLSALLGGFLILLLVPFSLEKQTHARLLLQGHIIKYMAMFGLVGVFATTLDFFFQVGSLSQTGFTGMFDAVMRRMVAQSTLGTIAISRLCIFIVGIAFCGSFYWQLARKKTPQFIVTLLGAIILWGSIGYVFMLSGHTVQLERSYGYALAVHVIIALSWMGALWPLSAACLHLSPTPLYTLMRKFGHLAIGLVSLLLLAGTLLAWELVGSVGNLFNQIYGQSLLLKLGICQCDPAACRMA